MFLINRRLMGLLAFLGAAALVGANLGGLLAQEPSEAEQGKKDFVEMGCYQCHNFAGQGAGGTGARLAPDPLPYEAFSRIVRHPYNVMPAYSEKVLSEEKLKRIYAYLESIPQPPDVSSIPLLSGQ